MNQQPSKPSPLIGGTGSIDVTPTPGMMFAPAMYHCGAHTLDFTPSQAWVCCVNPAPVVDWGDAATSGRPGRGRSASLYAEYGNCQVANLSSMILLISPYPPNGSDESRLITSPHIHIHRASCVSTHVRFPAPTLQICSRVAQREPSMEQARWFRSDAPRLSEGIRSLSRDALEELLASVVAAAGGSYSNVDRPSGGA